MQLNRNVECSLIPSVMEEAVVTSWQNSSCVRNLRILLNSTQCLMRIHRTWNDEMVQLIGNFTAQSLICCGNCMNIMSVTTTVVTNRHLTPLVQRMNRDTDLNADGNANGDRSSNEKED